MKIAICDDEQTCIDNVIRLLDRFSADNNIDFEKYTFTSAERMLNEEIKFDIAILDVEMSNINGITLGEKLRAINPHIILIYITAHKKYLDDALNLNAVRFFEKPIDENRFYRGLKDSIDRIDNTTVDVFLKDGKTIEKINAKDIIYVEIEKRQTKAVTVQKEYHCNHHISFWKNQLSSTVFVSPHKSFIINMNYVTAYDRDKIILNDKYEISIARNRQTGFYQQFMRFMEGK